MGISYTPGRWYAVISGTDVVMLSEDVNLELLDEVWRALATAGEVSEVLQLLTWSYGPTLTTLPPFVVARGDTDRLRVALRGPVTVTLDTADGVHRLTGAGVSTWTEQIVERPRRIAIDVVDPDGTPRGPRLPVTGGVVTASSLTVPFDAEDVAVQPSRAPDPGDRRADLYRSSEPPDSAAGLTPSAGPLPSAASPGTPLAPAPSPMPPVAPSAPAPAPSPTPAPSAGVVSSVPAASEPSPASLPAAPPSPQVPGAPSGGLSREYDQLWGATIAQPVAKPATPAPAPSIAEPPIVETPTGQLRPAATDHLAVRPVEIPAPSPVPGAGSLPAGGVQSMPSVSSLPSAPSAVGVSAASVPSPAAVSGQMPAVPTGPKVLARACVNGHANSPESETCFICSQPVVGESSLMPRPALGRMIISGGETIPLLRSVVIGRKPQASRVPGSELPQLVAVASPQHDVSRSHLSVQLEEWAVLASDLATTNGTILLREGQPPRRLFPNEAALVLSGDVFDLGDGVTVTFEGLP